MMHQYRVEEGGREHAILIVIKLLMKGIEICIEREEEERRD